MNIIGGVPIEAASPTSPQFLLALMELAPSILPPSLFKKLDVIMIVLLDSAPEIVIVSGLTTAPSGALIEPPLRSTSLTAHPTPLAAILYYQ